MLDLFRNLSFDTPPRFTCRHSGRAVSLPSLVNFEKSLLFLLVFNSFVTCIATQKMPRKKVLLIEPAYRAGICFEMVKTINHLAWASKNKLQPVIYWDARSPYFQPNGFNNALYNAWEYYFLPVSSYPLHPKEVGAKIALQKSHRRRHVPWLVKRDGFIPDTKSRIFACHIIDRYIHLNQSVINKIDQFYSEHFIGKKTVGIHLRGTDKNREAAPVPPERIFAIAQKYAELGYQFFVATDEFALLSRAKQELAGPVTNYDCFRSHDKQPIHLRYLYSKAQVGEDMLVEAYLLSRCDVFIHTQTNVAGFVLCLNPALQNILVSP